MMTKVKTLDHDELNPIEKKNLKKRGFLSLELISQRQYFITLFSHTIFLLASIFAIIIGLSFIDLAIQLSLQEISLSIEYIFLTLINISLVASVVSPILLFFYITYKFCFFHHAIISNAGIIVNKHIYKNAKEIPIAILLKSQKINSIGLRLMQWVSDPGVPSGDKYYMIGMIMSILIRASIYILGFLFFPVFLLGNIIVFIVNQFISLNKFTSLSSHIQSLTPTIEEKSREIETNFGEDMDFSKLRSGFDELSRSLAKVSEYIVKLELAEKKANKGNLFDSVKYINSLKGDIVKPLVALRSFLSTRLRELEESKGELSKVRVRVGGGEEAIALQSARTEPLMGELRDNIEKLDAMIGKF